MNNDAYIQISKNPLSDLISDDVFGLLIENGLLDEKSLRDYTIKRKFKILRDNDIGVGDAVEIIMEDYPYLQFDTIKKLVYRNGK